MHPSHRWRNACLECSSITASYLQSQSRQDPIPCKPSYLAFGICKRHQALLSEFDSWANLAEHIALLLPSNLNFHFGRCPYCNALWPFLPLCVGGNLQSQQLSKPSLLQSMVSPRSHCRNGIINTLDISTVSILVCACVGQIPDWQHSKTNKRYN